MSAIVALEQVSPPATDGEIRAALEKLVAIPSADRLFYVADGMRVGMSDRELFERTAIDPWFLAQIRRLIVAEGPIARGQLEPQDGHGHPFR